jgi:hypothetical protein
MKSKRKSKKSPKKALSRDSASGQKNGPRGFHFGKLSKFAVAGMIGGVYGAMKDAFGESTTAGCASFPIDCSYP